METAESFELKSLLSIKGAAAIASSAVLLVAGGGLAASNSLADSDVIVRGVRAEGKDISGMTTTAAHQYLQSVGNAKAKPLNFSYGEQTFTIAPEEINFAPKVDEAMHQAYSFGRGGDWTHNIQSQIRCALNGRNVVLTAGYDETLLTEKLNEIAAQINQQPSNAYCYINGDGSIGKVAGVIGYKLDTEKLALSLKTPLETLDVPKNIELQPEEILPFVTTEDVEAIDSIIGEYTTSYAPGARGDNIALAASYLNDKIIKTGWEFSFNDTVGERTYAAGYQTAGVIVNGRTEDGVGGGVCQVSSTLYNAILLAGLTPTVRTSHFFPSTYVAPGRDATVADGQIDFKFRNDLPHNVYLLSSAGASSVTIFVLGTRADLNGAKITIEQDGSTMKPSVYRVFYRDGQVVKEEFLHTDTYDEPVTD